MRSALVVVVAAVLAVAGCGQAGVGSPSDVTFPVEPDESLPAASTTPPPNGCGEVPNADLQSGDARVTMDLVVYAESTDTCGYNADGGAMFDDSFRPESALLARGGEFSVVTSVVGDFSVDISPLETGLRLASIEPSLDVLARSSDNSYVLSLPGPGCFAVTVELHGEGRHGRFTGLVESEIDACAIIPSSTGGELITVQKAVGEVTVVAVHDDFSFYGPCGNNSVDVFGTTYFQLYAEEFEALDESRYPKVIGETAAPAGFARVSPPGPGDDIGTLIVYSDGMARYESDSGTVEWLTIEEHTYNWEC